MIDMECYELRSQVHEMRMEGRQDTKPSVTDIISLAILRGYSAENIAIFWDDFQRDWCWTCDIKRQLIVPGELG